MTGSRQRAFRRYCGFAAWRGAELVFSEPCSRDFIPNAPFAEAIVESTDAVSGTIFLGNGSRSEASSNTTHAVVCSLPGHCFVAGSRLNLRHIEVACLRRFELSAASQNGMHNDRKTRASAIRTLHIADWLRRPFPGPRKAISSNLATAPRSCDEHRRWPAGSRGSSCCPRQSPHAYRVAVASLGNRARLLRPAEPRSGEA